MNKYEYSLLARYLKSTFQIGVSIFGFSTFFNPTSNTRQGQLHPHRINHAGKSSCLYLNHPPTTTPHGNTNGEMDSFQQSWQQPTTSSRWWSRWWQQSKITAKRTKNKKSKTSTHVGGILLIQCNLHHHTLLCVFRRHVRADSNPFLLLRRLLLLLFHHHLLQNKTKS